ncbi:hypothetical protein HGA64_04865 [Candidatus Falkowbacteria bacterium]|nr:hypothetical protein [Candidatus Falkowbacteria bacterium]
MEKQEIKPVEAAPLPSVSNDELKHLLEENQALLRDVHEMTRKIKGYITFQKVLSFIYFIIIVVPLVIGAIYLPPILKPILEQYKNLLGSSDGQGLDVANVIKALPK